MKPSASLLHLVQSIERETNGWPRPMARRRFLQAALALAGTQIVGASHKAQAQAQPLRFVGYPFTLGVASGAPRPDSVVLWTRLAPAPLLEDGGMPPERVIINWELAEDEKFARIVQQGRIHAAPELAHSVHAEVTGLRPGRWYWYRFIAGGEMSPAGRTRTADVQADRLRFAVASCQQYEQGYFSAYRHMSKEDLDLVAFLGDYIYESNWGSNLVRRHATGEPETLAQYRIRHAQYKTDADLQAMHHAAPWIVTWDDHEVDNDYAGDQSEYLDPRFLLRRAAAYQAYYEHMPVPRSALPRGPHMRIYDRYSFGSLAQFHVLDDRQYRTPQACPRMGMGGASVTENCAGRMDPKLDMLGAAQEQWLADGLKDSRALWNVLAQQTLLAPFGRQTAHGTTHWTDGWDGYPAARTRLTRLLGDSRASNPLVIGGDVHCHHAANILYDFDKPTSRIVASEFVSTSITSEGDPIEMIEAGKTNNPHMLLSDARRRGYIMMELGRQRARVDMRVIDSEKVKESRASTLAAFEVEAGKPGARQIQA
ncbi:alkaline phosphatase [Massilia arenosa]|uniref:Alkaline phosphatase n=1 Tax=Zemynaea arenosa TaxID=2561931 RepID=A0A4Y9RUD9_9BURK|nr:alkaline phosphatase D family protein [Massilia arenosa]TFW11416.1 alkaline phosphatase [Massilia arenosa]